MEHTDPKKKVIPPKTEKPLEKKKEEDDSFSVDEDERHFEDGVGSGSADAEEGGSGWYPPEDDA